jgi:hypothetical protein
MLALKSDAEFSSWIQDHRLGYVVNTLARPDPHYIVLHRASCPMIDPSRARVAEGALHRARI